MKNQIALLFFLLVVIQSVAYAIDIEKECILYNKRYKNQYIYAANNLVAGEKKFFTKDRYVFAWIFNKVGRIFGFRKTNEFFDSDPAGIWKLIPIDTEAVGNNVFYLRNVQYPDEYLYASRTKYGDSGFASDRRRVFSRMLGDNDSPDHLLDQFTWSFNKTDKYGEYQIYNTYFKEPLYVSSLYNRHSLLRRNVFTWHKEPDSQQFTFVVSCRDGLLSLK